MKKEKNDSGVKPAERRIVNSEPNATDMPLKARPTTYLALVLAIATLAAGHAYAVEPPFPMHVGDTWTYEAKVEWVGTGNETKSATVPWTMKVVDVVRGPHVRAFVVQDFLWHLAWHDPSAPKEPAYDVFVVRVDGLWIDDDVASREDARAAAKRASTGETVGHQLLRFPLHEKDCVDSAEDVDRNDGSYCWLLTRGQPRRGRAWHVEYRSLPDHASFDFTEGVGFTEYQYVHHGTVASAHAVLRGKTSAK